MSQNLNFEQAMMRLQEIADTLERTELPIDESIKLFEEGLKLSKLCQEKLNGYEKKISDLVKENQEEKSSAND